MLGRDLTNDYIPYIAGYLDTLFGGEWNFVQWELIKGYNGFIFTNGTVNVHVEMLFNLMEDRWYPGDNVRFSIAAKVVDTPIYYLP